MSSNPVSIGLITQGVQERWNVDVWTVVLDGARDESAVLTHEVWIMASMSNDTSTIEDAVQCSGRCRLSYGSYWREERRYLLLTGQISAMISLACFTVLAVTL